MQCYDEFVVMILWHFKVSFYKTILIITSVTLCNRLHLQRHLPWQRCESDRLGCERAKFKCFNSSTVTLWNRVHLHLSRIIGLWLKEIPLKYFSLRIFAESGRFEILDFDAFEILFVKNMCSVTTTCRLRFHDIFWTVSMKPY